MDDNTEHHIALREAHQIGASDSFFAARKELRDTEHERYIFDAGFRRGFDCHESLQRKATAAPPADAALADLIAHMEHGAKLVDAIGALCRDGSPERNAADAIRKAAAALRARAVPEGKKYHDVAQRLYALLDDIDTVGDIAKSDDKLYRGIVERTQAKKRDFVVSCDGYTVTLADDSMLTASKEAP